MNQTLEEMRERGMKAREVLIAVMHKMIVAASRLMKTGEMYDPIHELQKDTMMLFDKSFHHGVYSIYPPLGGMG